MEITCGFTGESFDAVSIQPDEGKKNLTLLMLFASAGGCHKASNY